MRTKSAAASALLLATLLTVCADAQTVHELGQGSFDKFAAKSDAVLLEVYAPSCVHCRHFESSYTAVANALSESEPRVAVARVDAHSNRVMVQRFGVTVLPSFYLVRGSSVHRFTGRPSVGALVRFARTDGADRGEPHQATLGPFHPYWRAVAAFVSFAERAHLWVLSDPNNRTIAAVAAFACVISMIFIFITFIHLLTKPPPPRPHTE